MQYFRFRSRRVFRRSLHKTLSAKKLTPGVDYQGNLGYENPCGSTAIATSVVAVLSWAETLGLVLLELAALLGTLGVLWLVSRS